MDKAKNLNQRAEIGQGGKLKLLGGDSIMQKTESRGQRLGKVENLK